MHTTSTSVHFINKLSSIQKIVHFAITKTAVILLNLNSGKWSIKQLQLNEYTSILKFCSIML